jgi:hypothetical protein
MSRSIFLKEAGRQIRGTWSPSILTLSLIKMCWRYFLGLRAKWLLSDREIKSPLPQPLLELSPGLTLF